MKILEKIKDQWYSDIENPLVSYDAHLKYVSMKRFKEILQAIDGKNDTEKTATSIIACKNCRWYKRVDHDCIRFEHRCIRPMITLSKEYDYINGTETNTYSFGDFLCKYERANTGKCGINAVFFMKKLEEQYGKSNNSS